MFRQDVAPGSSGGNWGLSHRGSPSKVGLAPKEGVASRPSRGPLDTRFAAKKRQRRGSTDHGDRRPLFLSGGAGNRAKGRREVLAYCTCVDYSLADIVEKLKHDHRSYQLVGSDVIYMHESRRNRQYGHQHHTHTHHSSDAAGWPARKSGGDVGSSGGGTSRSGGGDGGSSGSGSRIGLLPSLLQSATVVDTLSYGGHVFVFSFGVVLAWGVSKLEGELIVKALDGFRIKPLEKMEQDSFEYMVDESYRNEGRRASSSRASPYAQGGGGVRSSQQSVHGNGKQRSDSPGGSSGGEDNDGPAADYVNHEQDVIILGTTKGQGSQPPLGMVACSHALAQSVKLTAFEEKIDRTIDKSSGFARLLGHKKLEVSGTAVSQASAELFLIRSEIFEESDILDLPQYLWDNANLEPLYKQCCKMCDLERRLDVLEVRMNELKALFDTLKQELSVNHAHRLVVIINYLLLFQIIILLAWNICVKDFGGYFTYNGTNTDGGGLP